MNWLRGFLDNNSLFGRVMGRCGVIIGANLLFLVCCIPVVTVGAALAALHYTLLRSLRATSQIRLFRTFWKGLKDNWKQATAAWLGALALAAVLALELYWCNQFTGPVAYFRYGLLALLLAEALILLYLFPTMAAFAAPLPRLVQNSVYFIIHRPLDLVQIVFISTVPMLLTYHFLELLPLFAFLWAMFGFAAVALCGDVLLLKQFLPYLPAVDAAGDIIPDDQLDDPGLLTGDSREQLRDEEAKTLAEMTKYGL